LKLSAAYETLKDESKRRAYDIAYPAIKKTCASAQGARMPQPGHTSNSQPEESKEVAEIAALTKSKQERAARWQTKKSVFESSIFEMQRYIRRLEQEMKNLCEIAAAEAAEEAYKKSWGAWLLSPIYKQREDTEEEKERKDREKQERQIEKDMKERRLTSNMADLKAEQTRLRKAEEEVDAATAVDEAKIRTIENRRKARAQREREKKEKLDAERLEKLWREQQEQERKRAQEAAERFWQQQNAARAAEEVRKAAAHAALKKQEEESWKRRQKIYEDQQRRNQQYASSVDRESNNYSSCTSTCIHDGWWGKVQGRAACPVCNEVWNYLLQCPSCVKRACPRCQSTIRPRFPRGQARFCRRDAPRAPNPEFYDPYD
jgi:hypothetical protein